MMVFAVAVLAVGPTFAGDKGKDNDKDKVKNQLVIKGKVVEDGKPQDGAEIRVKSLDRKMPDKVVLTDSRGKYIVLGLQPGNYTVTAHDVDMKYPRSRALIKVNRNGWANVNFDLGLDKDAGNDASRIAGHAHFTQPNSHGSIMSATQ